MNTDPNESQERIDTSHERTSPSAGWKEVYAEMGVSPSGDVESQRKMDHEEPPSRENGVRRREPGDDLASGKAPVV